MKFQIGDLIHFTNINYKIYDDIGIILNIKKIDRLAGYAYQTYFLREQKEYEVYEHEFEKIND